MTQVEAAKKTSFVSTLYPISAGPEGLKAAVDALVLEAERQVRDGAEVIVLTDRKEGGMSPDDIFIPPLVAVGAVHHHLIQAGVRLQASIISETAHAWSTHHIACLVGFGASAVHPYMLFRSVKMLYTSEKRTKMRASGQLNDISLEQSNVNTRNALEAGVLKILSKIGISLLSSYHGAQIFEAIGIGKEIIDSALVGTPSRIGGLSYADLAEEVAQWNANAAAYKEGKPLMNYGFVKYYQKLEHHQWNPPMSRELHKALRSADVEGDGLDMYNLYKDNVKKTPVSVIRDMLEIESDREPIPLEEVEPVEEIMKRFCTGGMSLGALSREAHETLAMGVNRAGGRSNSGEGGEDEIRWTPVSDADEEGKSETFPHLKGLQNGDLARSKIKQVASGRFGVTPAYLMSAEQIEIKVAQGAKPGEGGQLPGGKVNAYIASIRACKEGVMLISPPPHHDIYSIEDLSQLIWDLHEINPRAKVSVKLVAQVGIGTVASGVAKAEADIIQISGHDGGTGASPLTSVKHAGGPWELGLAEAHQQLVLNGLRDRVVLRVDGGLKTGYDIVMGALLGADEFGFGTIAMISVGCIVARICHTNNCPVGVTTQKENLRKKFVGVPSDTHNFFVYAADEVRHCLAALGYRSLGELVGRADLLQQRDTPLMKTAGLDLSYIKQIPQLKTAEEREQLKEADEVHAQQDTLDDEMLLREDVQRAIFEHEHVTIESPITNVDRTASARITGTIAKAHGNKGWKGSLHIIYTGCAGQSFGFACLPGLDLEVRGDANDYVGKSMHGGRIRVRPVDCIPGRSIGFDASESIIVGNTCLYGATGGKFFACGRAGERFCVRNSNAKAVVEGTGDHCCEYMTGGVVVVLGPVGRNVGAGQTGGWGYFLVEGEINGRPYTLDGRVNADVQVQEVNAVGAVQLRALIEEHVEATGSKKAQMILDNWDEYLPKFRHIYPMSEKGEPEVSGIPAVAVEEEMLV
uniref:glutamate synthase (ferredoxin) n=1 Tax=Haptolina brevifila TaxID=156173 RepID=A0A7S2DXM1_9EUKA